MPLYEFVCGSCGFRWEDFLPAGTRPACSSCGGSDVGRVFSPYALKVDQTTSDRYLQWYYSDEVQDGLRTGKYRHIRKDEDVNHL